MTSLSRDCRVAVVDRETNVVVIYRRQGVIFAVILGILAPNLLIDTSWHFLLEGLGGSGGGGAFPYRRRQERASSGGSSDGTDVVYFLCTVLKASTPPQLQGHLDVTSGMPFPSFQGVLPGILIAVLKLSHGRPHRHHNLPVSHCKRK